MPRVEMFNNLSPVMTDLLARPYAARLGAPKAICLANLWPGATVFGRSLFLLACGDALIEEQIQPPWKDGVPPGSLRRLYRRGPDPG